MNEKQKTELDQLLLLATSSGDVAEIQELISEGADPNCIDKYTETPLHLATQGKNVAIMATLLNHSASINVKTYYGKTALHIAANRGDMEAARLLLRRGAEVDPVSWYHNNRTPLHEALGIPEMVQLLLVYGADIEHRNNWGATPLHMAARVGDEETVHLLLSAGADRAAVDEKGETPLKEAKINSPSISYLFDPTCTQIVPGLDSKGDVKRHMPSISKSQSFRSGNRTSSNGPMLTRYREASRELREAINHSGFLSSDELALQSRVYSDVLEELGFRYQPDEQERIDRNDAATNILLGDSAYESYKDIVSEISVLPLRDLLELKRFERHQELSHHTQWLSPEEDPILVIFVSHRWEHSSTPDPYGSQLHILKTIAELFIQIVLGSRESRERRLQRVSTLCTHGALQAAFFAGEIATFIDGFKGSQEELRTALLNRVGIAYDFISLPQEPRTVNEQTEFEEGMHKFRRLMDSAPILALRYPDDEYSSRTWCELEFWSHRTSTISSFSGLPVLRLDLLGKEIEVARRGPPSNFNSWSNHGEVMGALTHWEEKDSETTIDVLRTINRNYDLAFSQSEKEESTPLISRPDFNTESQNRIWKGKAFDVQRNRSAVPPSFNLWCSVRERLCEGLENEDFEAELKYQMDLAGVRCSENRDTIATGLWLLGRHEIYADWGFLTFYGRCLLRHLLEGKDLQVDLFYRQSDQAVHYRFADGEESLEGY